MLGNARDCFCLLSAWVWQTSSFPTSRLFYHPLPYRYFRATRTSKVEIPVCALSTTKGTVQLDPADYPCFCTADGWEGALLLKNNLPCLHVSDCQEAFLCLLVISAISFCLFNCFHAQQCSSSTSLESFRVFPTPAVFEFTLQGNQHPDNLVMQQFLRVWCEFVRKLAFEFSGSRLFFLKHTKELTWTAAIHFSPCFLNRMSSWRC